MTVTLIKGLVSARPEQQQAAAPRVQSPQAPQANPQAQAQASAATTAAAQATQQASDAAVAVLRLSSRETGAGDRIRDPEKAQETAEKVADDIRDREDGGLDAHGGLTPGAARDHIVA